jgi:hypothetical protein
MKSGAAKRLPLCALLLELTERDDVGHGDVMKVMKVMEVM